MHLKTLTLRGFKSFAGTTTMRLEPGITCVVGPNGSGKSNVVDALAWVMGEQGAKTLRGAQMSDVIFAGTSTRPALGRAQVELTIDNSDGLLPIEYSEVTISRTLFRGGGSEYSINNAPARLLDIQELLSDTGMGRQMHVIVGQGQLDAILSSTPEERRAFIEEAAGVLKHRRRKERALKKLSDMDANLVRVLDVTHEIHRQLGPLARQAKAARRAHRVHAALRDAQSRLLADDIMRAREQLEAHNGDNEATRLRLAQLQEQTAQLSEKLRECEQAEAHFAPAVDRATQAWQRAMTLQERLGATLLAAQERLALHSDAYDPPVGDDPHDLEERARKASQEDAELLEQVEAQRQKLLQATRTKELCEAEENDKAQRLAQAHRALADYREKIARLTGDMASARSRYEAAQAEAERAHTVLREAITRQEETQSQIPPQEEESVYADENSAAHAHTRAIEKRDAARAQVDTLLIEEREARTDRAHWQSRRDALAQSLTPHDATAHLIGRAGIMGDIPTFLRITAGYEDAIAALLAPFADAVLADTLAVAIDELRRGHQESTGRMRMVIANRSVPSTQRHSTPQPDLPHGTRWAIECVHVDSVAYSYVMEMLQGAVICEDLEQAAQLLKREDVRTVVTQHGDCLSQWWVTGQGQATSSPLALRAHYDEAAAQATAAHEREKQAAARLIEAHEILDLYVKEANEALRALREEDAERAKIAQERARLMSAAQAASAEAERARSIAQRADDQVAWAHERVEEARIRVEAASALTPPEDVTHVQQMAESAAQEARSARENETQAKLTLRALEEQSRQIQARARHLRQSAARMREEHENYRRRESKRQRLLDHTRSVIVRVEHAIEAAQMTVSRATCARDQLAKERSDISENISRYRQKLSECHIQENELREAAQRDEIARAELRMRLEHVQARALEELGCESDELVEQYGPHILVPAYLVQGNHSFDAEPPQEGESVEMVPYVRQQQENARERAQKELTRIGRVNPLALEEHEALTRRHEFLVSQVQDLKKSKADLLDIVRDVDRLVQEAFARAWNETAEQFESVFSTLFPGGQGRLVLTDPEDMLTTGIEIEARPAGKKVKRLSLLSGGERSLAALAFLVAIFRACPSPFYVMDEVEAALDDVNLSRLIEVFRQLQETSQLIVVTHQKRTMEIADALYGVTMREGVTRVVSQRLKQVDETHRTA
ncbi:chromosome segregation protein SMC [Schaalia sp. lx-100]|uniref:chromosome segregation protein SMC n=1 Tax=Schaalia sp. lx-100 TaxID=2899081 RepID=UPI001E3CE0DF|nr:chromosome segregation protein SMC [Schaalia sp. lx-100]